VRSWEVRFEVSMESIGGGSIIELFGDTFTKESASWRVRKKEREVEILSSPENKVLWSKIGVLSLYVLKWDLPIHAGESLRMSVEIRS
jgi:hypothetical protein